MRSAAEHLEDAENLLNECNTILNGGEGGEVTDWKERVALLTGMASVHATIALAMETDSRSGGEYDEEDLRP